MRTEDITFRDLLYKARDFYPLFNSDDFLTEFASSSFQQVRVARSDALICGCLKGADNSCEYITWNDRMRIAVCCHLMPEGSTAFVCCTEVLLTTVLFPLFLR